MGVRQLDSGLLVVVIITLTMILIVIYCLLFVKYEWCHVLFANNTVGSAFINNIDFSCFETVQNIVHDKKFNQVYVSKKFGFN